MPENPPQLIAGNLYGQQHHFNHSAAKWKKFKSKTRLLHTQHIRRRVQGDFPFVWQLLFIDGEIHTLLTHLLNISEVENPLPPLSAKCVCPGVKHL